MEMFYVRSWFGVSLGELIDQINDYMKWYREKRLKLSLAENVKHSDIYKQPQGDILAVCKR